MLLIDGVRYKLWKPKDEENEFHPMIKEHSKEIFGEDAIYFDVKHKLTSKSGIASIPDAYIITISKPYKWYIIENELSSHPVYSHIVPQVSKFISGIENPRSQREIRELLYNEIDKNKVLRARVEEAVGSEVFRFLSELLSKPPVIVIVIDEITDEVKEVQSFLKQYDTHVIEFKTYVRENAETVHAHIFEQIYPIKTTPKVTMEKLSVRATTTELKLDEVKTGDALEVEIKTASPRKYALFYIPKKRRRFFPGYKVYFILETDIGEIKTRVTGGRAGMPIGDPDGGAYIQGGLKAWYIKHPELTVGRKVRFECIKPYERYKLVIV
jgi:hypothetical protein